MIYSKSAALSFAIILASCNIAPALSLKGTAFTLLAKVDPGLAGVYLVIERLNGDLEFVYDKRSSGPVDPKREVFRQPLDKFGAPQADATFVTRGASPYPLVGGALPLANGKSFIGYVDLKAERTAAFARVVDSDGHVGDEVLIDDSEKSNIFISATLDLSSKYIVITDGGYPKSKKDRTNCNFIGMDGSVNPDQVDITFGNKGFTEVNKYMGGFIGSYGIGADGQFLTQSFDDSCQRVGPARSFSALYDGEFARSAYALGLTDGSIAVFRSFKRGSKYFMTAQFFNEDGSQRSPQTVLEPKKGEGLSARFFAASDGNFVGVSTIRKRDGRLTGLEIQTYNQELERVGDAAKINGYNYPNFQDIIPLRNGDSIVLFRDYSKDNSRLRIYGQIIAQ